jgi:8-oxo-dGTP pyrophosphatase MutT (NUDIX family)
MAAEVPRDHNEKNVRKPGAKAVRPRDAATLILYRRSSKSIEVVMGERHAKHSFMPNNWVFPGGGVEPMDWRVRGANDLQPHVAKHLGKAATKARVRALAAAAIRETHEETGLILGKPDPEPGRSVPMNWRDFFATGYAPDFDALEYVYRAVTPPYRPRRFNARFFMADSARLANEVIESSGELLDIHWVTIEKALTLPIPRITGVVLKTIEDILENPPAKDAPRPVFKVIHGTPTDTTE